MKLRRSIDEILKKALILIMGIMVINVLWQVFTRYVVGDPSSFTDELARYLMIWSGVLGAAYVSGQNQHVAIGIIPSRSSEKTRYRLKRLVNLLILIFAVLALVIGGSRLVYISHILGQHSAALQIPMAPVYSVIPISGLLIIYYKASDLYLLSRQKLTT